MKNGHGRHMGFKGQTGTSLGGTVIRVNGKQPKRRPEPKPTPEIEAARERFVPRNQRPAAEGGRAGWSRNDWMKN